MKKSTKLLVCKSICSESEFKQSFSKIRFIIVQHILSDTLEFVRLLKISNAEIFSISGISYSVNRNILKSIKSLGFNISILTDSQEENDILLTKTLNLAIEKSQIDNKYIIIIDLGGHYSKILTLLNNSSLKHILGVIEDTTFGHNLYLKNLNKIKTLIFSVARSPLKEIEAQFVGNSVVSALEHIYRGIGETLVGKKILVIGFGMIGKNIALELDSRHYVVSVHDINDLKKLEALTKGFIINELKTLLKNADIIISATGSKTISYKDIKYSKSNIILVSAGSKNLEFDIKDIYKYKTNVYKICKFITKIYLKNDKNLLLVNNGYPINFIINSVPDQIIDLVFSEILFCTHILESRHKDYSAHIINTINIEYLNKLASIYLNKTSNE